MTRFDQFIYRYNAWFIVAAAAGFNLSVEHLSERGYSAPTLLVYRGALGSALIGILALAQGVSLIPRTPRGQVVRFLNTGIAMLLAFEAFHRLEGVTVATIQRLDIPFAVLIGVALRHQLRDGRFALALLAVGLVLSSFLFADKMDEDPFGLAMAIFAVALTAVAYLLSKQSLAVENNLTVLNVSNLGCLFVGLLVCALRGNIQALHLADLWLFGVLTLGQFTLNYLLALLLRQHDVTRAQRPYLLSAVVILGLEMVTEHKWFSPIHIAFVLVVVGVVYLITITKAPMLPWRATRAELEPEPASVPA